jgi:hypothetical protein
MGVRAAIIAACVAALGVPGCTAAPSGSGCDRSCLVSVGETYLAALAAHDPGAAPLADHIAFVENVTPLKLGEGLWSTAVGFPGAFRIVVPDPERGAIGMMALVEQRSGGAIVPKLLAVRLKVEGRRITEVEHIVGDIQPTADLARLQKPRPGLIAVVPEDERMSRAALTAIAASYYDALAQSDGSRAPFAPDCERQENGAITAAPYLTPAAFDSVDVHGNRPPPVARDCAGQMSSRRFAYIDSIDYRRVFAADPVQGLAMGLSHFRQSMRRGPHEMIAADGSRVMWEEKREPYDLPAAHVFKITGGQIHEVEAIGAFVPYMSPTGWEQARPLQ